MLTRILIFGTFDGIHEGHRSFFGQARALADAPYLIASIARDVNVVKIKGRMPDESEQERLTKIKNEPLVDLAVLGTTNDNYLEHIVELRPDIIALGYDQNGTMYTEDLENKLRQVHCNAQLVRCAAHMPEVYKSSKLRR